MPTPSTTNGAGTCVEQVAPGPLGMQGVTLASCSTALEEDTEEGSVAPREPGEQPSSLHPGAKQGPHQAAKRQQLGSTFTQLPSWGPSRHNREEADGV